VRRLAPAFLPLLAVAVVAACLTGQAQARAGSLDRLIAPPGTCLDEGREAPAAGQEAAMRCLVDFARRRAGLHGLSDSSKLDRSASDKAHDILRCDSFSHFACGRDFTYWMRRVGYIPAHCWRVGENLAWGSGHAGSVRSAFSLLIHSPEHRANILGAYSAVGIGLRVGTLAGSRDAHVWIQHFGSHCVARRHRRIARLAHARRVP
jgi:uncharacterized protein YkwD